MPVEFEVNETEPRTPEDDAADIESWRLGLTALLAALVASEMPIGKASELVARIPTLLERTVGCNGKVRADDVSWRVAEELVRKVDNTVSWRRLILRRERAKKAAVSG